MPVRAGAAHAMGVADGDRTAIDIVLAGIDAEAVAAIKRLHGEGFVELPEVDVFDLEAVLLQELRHGKDGADPHLVWLTPRHRHAAIDAERLEPALLHPLHVPAAASRSAAPPLPRIASAHAAAVSPPLH